MTLELTSREQLQLFCILDAFIDNEANKNDPCLESAETIRTQLVEKMNTALKALKNAQVWDKNTIKG